MNKIAMKMTIMNATVASEEEYDKYAALKMPNINITKAVKRLPRSFNNYLGNLTGMNINKTNKFYKQKFNTYYNTIKNKEKNMRDLVSQSRTAHNSGDQLLSKKLDQAAYNENRSLYNITRQLDSIPHKRDLHIARLRDQNKMVRQTTGVAALGLGGTAAMGLGALSVANKQKANNINTK